MNTGRRLAVIALILLTGTASAQDALRGKLLYLDGGRLNGAGVSCVDCHGGLPGALHGIGGKAANKPSAIEYALGVISAMAPLRGRLDVKDLEDLAAYIGRPDVPSPAPLFLVGEAGRGIDRLEFRSPGMQTVRLSNSGGLSLRLTAAPILGGPHAADFSIASTSCLQGMQLAPQQVCRVDIAFQPGVAGDRRFASLAIAHQWTGAGSYLALIGQAQLQRVP